MSASFDKALRNQQNKEVSIVGNRISWTYFLPVGCLSGLSYPNFNAAKTNSTGADE